MAFISRAKSSSAAGTSSPTTVCRVAPRLMASSRTLPICGSRHAGQPVAADDVHHHQFGARLRRDARCPAHQRLRLRPAGDRDDDALAGLPGGGDLVLLAVLRQGGVDLVGQPQQRELAQRGQVAAPEVVATAPRRSVRGHRRCRGTSLRRNASGVMSTSSIWSAARTTSSGTVSCCSMPVICATTSLRLSRCWTLTVEMTVMPCVEQLLDVLPALGVLAARGVGVGELVDEHHLGAPRQHRRRRRVRGTCCRGSRRSAAGRSRCRRAARRSSCGRGSPRPRPPRRCRAPAGGAPRRAWRTSCRRPAPHPGRCAAPRASAVVGPVGTG